MFRTAVVLKSKVQNGKRLIDSVTSICELKRRWSGQAGEERRCS